jgi:peptidoglycan/LPS O-acetylase OafA/YrhL
VGLAVFNAKLPNPLPAAWHKWLPRVGLVGLIFGSVSMLMSSKFLFDLTGKFGVPYPYVPMAVPKGVLYNGHVWVQYGHTLTAVAFMPALLAMARCGEWWANRALSWKPLRFLGRMSYTVYVWHTFFYFVILEALGADAFLGQKWRAPVLAVIAIVASLPIYYGVEQRMLRVKLRFASEKEVLDLNTGKMMSVEAARSLGKGTFSAEAVEDPDEYSPDEHSPEAYSPEAYSPGEDSPDLDGQPRGE